MSGLAIEEKVERGYLYIRKKKPWRKMEMLGSKKKQKREE